MQNQNHRNFPTPSPQREVVEMFNIVKRQDFMLGQDIPTRREAEELRLEKYGCEHIVVIPADTKPGKEFTSTNFRRRLLKRRHRGARVYVLRTSVIQLT